MTYCMCIYIYMCMYTSTHTYSIICFAIETLLKWTIWGYCHFKQPPCIYAHQWQIPPPTPCWMAQEHRGDLVAYHCCPAWALGSGKYHPGQDLGS